MSQEKHVLRSPLPASRVRSPLSRSLALVALVLLTYVPSLGNHFIWDDDFYITQNATLHDLSGLTRIWSRFGLINGGTPQYYPLTHTTFWIEHHLWGDWAVGYHLDNIFLHAISAVLLWKLLTMLDIPAAFLIALLWAVHPVNVESVAWATERKNVLSGVFYFGAFIAYWNWLGGKQRSRYFLALFLFICALLSKTTTSTLPAAILLVIWWKRGTIRLRDVSALIPFFILGAGMGALTGYIERTYVGASGAEFQIALFDRFIIAGRAIWFYFFKIIWPVKLIFSYPRWQLARWMIVYPVAALLLTMILIASRRRGLFSASLFFVGTLFPALGFVNVYPMRYSFVADHFQYIACIGILAIVGSLLWRAKWVAVAVVIALMALSWQHEKVFANSRTLWADTVSKNPASWLAHADYGLEVMADDPARAEAEFKKSLELNPKNAQADLNLGLLAEKRKEFAQAEHWYDEALRADPELADAHYNLGHLLAMRGDAAGAMEHCRRAIAINPDYSAARENLALLLANQGRFDEAIDQWQKALQKNPDSLGGHLNLGLAYLSMHKIDAATAEFREALRLRPDYALAHNDLGAAFSTQGKWSEAEAEFREAIKFQGDLVQAHAGLANALEHLGRGDEAIAEYRRVLVLQPDNPLAKTKLGVKR